MTTKKTISKCKKCKRLKEKAFLKGERCTGPKCPLVRKATGGKKVMGGLKSKHRKNTSEFSLQLTSKQKVKFGYGLREKQFKNYVKKVTEKGGSDASARIFESLESRLDNVVFRAGFAPSRSVSRQMVSHGHVMINGKRVNIPSYQMGTGDKFSIRPQSANNGLFKDIDVRMKKFVAPTWIKLDTDKKEGEIIGKPNLKNEPSTESSLVSILEFYSR